VKYRPYPVRPRPSLRGLLLATALAALASLHVAPAMAADPKASKFYEDALTRYEKKDLAGAIIQLKNALQIDKNLLTAQLLLGRVLLADGQPGQAEVAFTEALRLGVNRAEVITDLAASLVDQGKQPLLLSDTRFETAGLPPGVQARLLLQKASAAADVGDIREAYALLERARSLNPNDAGTYVIEIALRVRERRFDLATAAADKALAVAGPSAGLLYQQAQIDHVSGRLEEAVAGYTSALKLDPAHVESLLARGGLMVDMNRLPEAQRDVDAVQKVSPPDPRGAFLGALLAEKAGNPVAARVALKTVTGLIDPVPMDYLKFKAQVLMLNGLAHYGLGEREAAKPYLEAYQRLDPRGGVSKLLAQILLAEGNIDAAIGSLETYLRFNAADSQAQALLASAHMAQGRPGRAVSVAQNALKRGDSAELRTALGLGLLRSGRTADATTELEAAYRRNPEQRGAGATLVGLYLQQGQAKKALAVADGLVKAAPADASNQTLLGQARLASGQRDRARAAFNAAVALDAKLPGPQIALARLDSANGDHAAAVKRLSDLLARDERNVDIQFELAAALERQGQLGEAQRWLEKAVDHADPRNYRPGIALIDLHMRHKQAPQALEVAKKLTSGMPQELQPQLALARVALSMGDRDEARIALGTATRLANFDPALQLEVGLLQGMAGNLEGAAYSYEKALQGQTDYLPANAALVDIEIKRGQLDKAEERARGILKAHPKLAIGHSLTADVAWARGRVPEATAAYERAHRIEPSSDTLLSLQNALRFHEGPKAAIALMTQWLKSRATDGRVRSALAGLLASTGQFAAARVHYDTLLKSFPEDARALNNLANVLLKLEPAAAVPVAERALAAAPGDAGVIDTLGWVLLQNGQNDRALQLLRDARLRSPAQRTIRYHLAEALVKAGRHQEAKAELQAALAGSSPFEGQEEAQTLLHSLQR
jgi:cellulose synthase operon protein C